MLERVMRRGQRHSTAPVEDIVEGIVVDIAEVEVVVAAVGLAQVCSMDLLSQELGFVPLG